MSPIDRNPALLPPGGLAPGRPAARPRRPPARGAGRRRARSPSPTRSSRRGGAERAAVLHATRSRACSVAGSSSTPTHAAAARRGRRPRRRQGLARLTRTCRRHRVRGVRQQPHRDHGCGIRTHEGQRVHQHRQRRDRMSDSGSHTTTAGPHRGGRERKGSHDDGWNVCRDQRPRCEPGDAQRHRQQPRERQHRGLQGLEHDVRRLAHAGDARGLRRRRPPTAAPTRSRSVSACRSTRPATK